MCHIHVDVHFDVPPQLLFEMMTHPGAAACAAAGGLHALPCAPMRTHAAAGLDTLRLGAPWRGARPMHARTQPRGRHAHPCTQERELSTAASLTPLLASCNPPSPPAHNTHAHSTHAHSTHPPTTDNSCAFRDIKQVGYRKVLHDVPGHKIVEVEQVS